MKLIMRILLLTVVVGLYSFDTLQAQTPDEQLEKLGITLPAPSVPVANFVKYVRTGDLIFLAGHGPANMTDDMRGKLGKDLSIEQGYAAARATGVSLLATLKDALNGDLSRVVRIVRVVGMVNSDPYFYDQPKVINGCSDLLVEVFGEKGKHARAAVGMAALPSNIPVEIEMIVEVRD